MITYDFDFNKCYCLPPRSFFHFMPCILNANLNYIITNLILFPQTHILNVPEFHFLKLFFFFFFFFCKSIYVHGFCFSLVSVFCFFCFFFFCCLIPSFFFFFFFFFFFVFSYRFFHLFFFFFFNENKEIERKILCLYITTFNLFIQK